MSSLQQFNDVAIESGGRNDGGGGGGGGGGGAPPSCNGIEIVNVKDKDERRVSNVSDCSVEIMDLESGVDESKLHLAKNVKDCRICHLSMDATNQDSGIPIELGCSCKADLAAAHKQCAEAWFKIKGNK